MRKTLLELVRNNRACTDEPRKRSVEHTLRDAVMV